MNTVHFGLVDLIPHLVPQAIDNLPAGFQSDGDSWSVWGERISQEDGWALHVQHDFEGDPEVYDLQMLWKELDLFALGLGTTPRVADYAVISSKEVWSEDQMVVLRGGESRFVVLPPM